MSNFFSLGFITFPSYSHFAQTCLNNEIIIALLRRDQYSGIGKIAQTIESEIARLLPDLPEGIAEMAFKALGLSLDAADRLTGQQEHPATDEKTDS